MEKTMNIFLFINNKYWNSIDMIINIRQRIKSLPNILWVSIYIQYLTNSCDLLQYSHWYIHKTYQISYSLSY